MTDAAPLGMQSASTAERLVANDTRNPHVPDWDEWTLVSQCPICGADSTCSIHEDQLFVACTDASHGGEADPGGRCWLHALYEHWDLNDPDRFYEWFEAQTDLHKCPSCWSKVGYELRNAVLILECETVGCHSDRLASWRYTDAYPKTTIPVVPRRWLEVGSDPLSLVSPALRGLAEIQQGAPQVFQRGGQLVTVTAHGQIEVLTTLDLQMRLADAVRWITADPGVSGDVHVSPPATVARAAIAIGHYPALIPDLDRVTTVPMLLADGTLRTQPGYDPTSRCFYAPATGLARLELPDEITAADVEQAKELLLTELLGDFPFVSESDRANALSIVLTPFVRDLILGPTPLHWVGAPEPGTGKGKLVDSALAPACGRVASRSFPDSEAEGRKAITTALREGVAAIKWDNVKGIVRSASLEAALTEGRWTDRLLGGNTSIDLPITAMWTLTANNATPGTDLKRRCVPIRLDAKTELPYRRTGPSEGRVWRHPLPEWAFENRRDLVTAALILIRWWVQRGRPSGITGRLGSYEAWEAVVGGILYAGGIDGFLNNVDDLDASEDTERDELTEFLRAWQAAYGTTELTARQLVEDAALREHVGAHVATWSASCVGAFLRQRRDRIAGGLRLVLVPRRSVANAWRVDVVIPEQRR
jgi:hypothetical protein